MKKILIALATLASAASLTGCSDSGSVGGNTAATEEGAASHRIYHPLSVALHNVTGAPGTLLRILNENDTLTTCTASTSGELSGCSVQMLKDANAVYQMVTNPRTGSLYFLQYDTDSVLVCDGSQGLLSSCAPAAGGGSLDAPSFMALNADGTIAYLANENDTLAVCQVAENGTFSSCTATNMNGTLETPVGVALATGGYGTHAYLLNGETKSVITACTLAPSGMPSACQAQNNEFFTAPTTMAFSPNGQYAYIGNFDDNMAICRIGADASLSSCHAVDTGGRELFAGIQEIAVDAAGTNAYVVNARNSSITHCKLTAEGADFTECSPYSIEGFELTTDLALYQHAGLSSLFVASLYNDSVYGCALDANGALTGDCVATHFPEQ